MSLLAAVAPTWPPLHEIAHGPFVLRAGAGGGKRVSAAQLRAGAGGVPSDDALHSAEEAMGALGQVPMFSLRADEAAFDACLARRGYDLMDPTCLYHQPVAALTTQKVPRVTAFAIWEPLAIMHDIWAAGGIGPARLAVMHRVRGAKTGILGRIADKPAGAAFVAVQGDVAMAHALEVNAPFRRKGLARWMMIAAAHWAQAQGCATLALLVTKANGPANALYQSMGFDAAPGYHYRVRRADMTAQPPS